MAVPKRKASKSRKRHRMAHWKRKVGDLNLVVCSNAQCGRLHLPHRACPYCGHYRGMVVVRKTERRRR